MLHSDYFAVDRKALLYYMEKAAVCRNGWLQACTCVTKSKAQGQACKQIGNPSMLPHHFLHPGSPLFLSMVHGSAFPFVQQKATL
jgi:hypothetical protein